MSEFVCENCEIKIAEFKDGEMLVFCHSEKADNALKIPLKQLLAAAALDPKSLQILMKFYVDNPNLKFL